MNLEKWSLECPGEYVQRWWDRKGFGLINNSIHWWIQILNRLWKVMELWWRSELRESESLGSPWKGKSWPLVPEPHEVGSYVLLHAWAAIILCLSTSCTQYTKKITAEKNKPKNPPHFKISFLVFIIIVGNLGWELYWPVLTVNLAQLRHCLYQVSPWVYLGGLSWLSADIGMSAHCG